MIEKLDLEKRKSFGLLDWFAHNGEPSGAGLVGSKINELVDAVNTILSRTYTVPIEDIANVPQENKFDPYAEQRNYDVYVKNRHLIGKLCKFKSGAGYTYGILTNIKRKPSQWAFESNGRAFSYCEPVKSTDSIIYKGDNNEK